MKTLLTLCICCIVGNNAYPQAWVWEKPINTTVNSIATDPNDNIIVLGKSGTATQLSKFTKDGLLIWSKLLTKATAFTPSGSLVTDRNGNIYTFTEGFDSINHQFTGIKSTGITKFSSTGNILWHVEYTTCTFPISTSITKLSIQIDNDDNVYAGLFIHYGYCSSKTVYLGNMTAVPGGNSPEYYFSVGSINSSGTVRWLRAFGTTPYFGASGLVNASPEMAFANNTLYVSGYSYKYYILLDGNLVLDNNNNSAWLAAFNANNGQSNWGVTHNTFGIINAFNEYSFPSINASVLAGKIVLMNNFRGRIVFKPGDTLSSRLGPLLPGDYRVSSYYTIYSSLGTPVKGDTLRVVPDIRLQYDIVCGTRDNFYFCKSFDGYLKKVDTGFNLKWLVALPPAVEKIFIPGNTNDIIATYTRSGVVFLAKMADSSGLISGKAYADWNNDGIYTPAADTALSNIHITTNSSVMRSISGNDSGKYYMYATPGTYTLNANINHPYYEFLPATHAATITQYGDTVRGKDFRLRPLFNFTDISVNITAIDVARPGRVARYYVSAKNPGPTTTPVEVGIKLPPLSTYTGINGGTVTVNSSDSITIAFGNVNPWQTRSAILSLNISTSAGIGDTLKYYPKAYPYITDTLKYNNTDTLLQAIRASFDPNEKEVNVSRQPIADTGKAVVYTVHFQNTGTDTAFYVRIADTLSAKLDASSFNYIDASHTVTTGIKNNVLNFIFNPIILPDSNVNEPLSHGFVKFSVKPKSPVNLADTIYNKAAIYFDFNSPVITNSTRNWFYSAGPLPVVLRSFVAEKKTSFVRLTFVTATEQNLKEFIIERSTDGTNFSSIGNVTPKGNATNGSTYFFDDMSPGQGINFYRLKMQDIDQRLTYSWIVIAQFSGKDQPQVKVFPNPANDNLYINFNTTTPQTYSCQLVDAAGKIAWMGEINTGMRNTLSINISTMATGIYFISVKNGSNTFHQEVIIKH